MAQSNLTNAKKSKNDEFYTQYADIEKEIQVYIEYDPDVFRGKVVLSPCDDPEWSNFTKYFVTNFKKLGLKKYISTCYIEGSRGKIMTMTSPRKTKTKLLKGDGDFRSKEITALKDEADMVITNPPFSLFREFMKWMNP